MKFENRYRYPFFSAPIFREKRAGSVRRRILRYFCSRQKGPDMYFNQVEFGKRLQEVRKSRGITQEMLADLLGLASKQHISRMERGVEACSLDILVELSGLLHVSTDYLLMGTNPDKEITKAQLVAAISQLTDIADKL